jgi:hypothetical protein
LWIGCHGCPLRLLVWCWGRICEPEGSRDDQRPDSWGCARCGCPVDVTTLHDYADEAITTAYLEQAEPVGHD